MDDTTSVLRRRVRLIARLQQRGGATRFAAAEALGCDDRTITRDIAWLIQRGVPATSKQESSTQAAAWSVPKKWSAAKWLWGLMSSED